MGPDTVGMTPVARYLTPPEKRRTLVQWRRLHRTAGKGPGVPDPDMVEWCAQLNAIPGVCTVQSCAGHGRPGSVDSSGHVWVRLSAPMSAAFDAHALRLAASTNLIEQVTRIYAPWGQEVASIAFAGNERGLLADSMRLIVSFFRSLGARRS